MKVKTILIIIAVIAFACIVIPPAISENTELRSGIGNALAGNLIEQNKYDLAVMTTDWVLEADSSNIEAREMKVDALCGLEEYESASEMQKFIIADKGALADKSDLYKLAELSAKSGDLAECVEAYEMVVDMYDFSSMGADTVEGEDETSYHEKAAVLVKLQRYDEAIACYNSVLEINPSSSKAWIGLGDAYLYKSLYDKGQLKDMYKELGKVPSERDSVKRIDFSSFESHRRAVEAYQKAVEIDPLVYPAVAAKIMGSYEKSISSYQDILENL
ncbi:tetratricopeptide repeat protein [Methanoplanus endosymbiosus]|uniref:Tetratricopeptide repeat protein n=1 Tax=Methanoplanus endosymbiosus TaxID=33865 RepID=A0A9E7THV4_9EURY|nr:tetratricopeptide repeat protein [Methanoplanus endosymbiosus]UUX91273.1 tetratricopeptide repeat protein [Methanoplanus endosymbiosus]